MPDTNPQWWDFSLDPDIRTNADAAQLKDKSGTPLVNPPDENGRLSIEYGSYLGLDRLLDAQTPASVIPDERIFIVIHQLFELVFKQMTFDLGVVAQTLHQILGLDDASFDAICHEELPTESGPSPFWRPSMTAVARLRHSARSVLPAAMAYVGRGEDDDVLFSSLEYALFRDFLVPASGFQSAQLRLIQRAFGKSPLMNVRVFPGNTFGEHYKGCPVEHLAVGDPLVLQSGHTSAFPDENSPARLVADLDDIAHAVLSRFGAPLDDLMDAVGVPTIRQEDVDRAAARVHTTMGDRTDAEEATERFAEDLKQAVTEENNRRLSFGDARKAAHALHNHKSCLTFVLDRISATDAALHATNPDSFFTVHRKTVRRHVSDDSGTGGGGLPYLVTNQRFLLPLFPALVAYSDLRISGTDDHRERW